MDSKEREEILEEVYKLIQMNIYNTKSPYSINQKIQVKVDMILNKSTSSREDIIQDLFVDYMTYGYFERYDKEKGKLGPYIRRFINWRLKRYLNKVLENPEVLMDTFNIKTDGKLYVDFKKENDK